MSPPPTTPRGTPSWVVLVVFVALPLVLAFAISRQAGALVIRRKAVANAHGWAVENKNEGRLVWVLRGSHRERPFEAVSLLREGGGEAWRARVAVSRPFQGWVLVATPGDWQARDFGTISTLTTRSALPPRAPAVARLGGLDIYAEPSAPVLALPALLDRLSALPPGMTPLAISFVDDGVVLDGRGPLPEGEALVPVLDYLAGLVERLEPLDAGAP
ncbi:MAG: hypothetical protein INH41_27360 [Myxococcaceae bacterium]|nr:hypothetical protein [Myxococcaceae bacterium]